MMKKLLLTLMGGAILTSLWNCDNDKTIILSNEKGPSLDVLTFLKINNPTLKEDVSFNLKRDSVTTCLIPDLEKTDSLIASFDGEFRRVEVDGKIQESGITSNNFNHEVVYDVIGKDGTSLKYAIHLKGGHGLPRLDIHTDSFAPILSKENYVNALFSICNSPDVFGQLDASVKIKGRGNATWRDYPKKPYRIKFDKAISLHGPQNKNYILLAEYTDRSLLRTAYMATVSKILNMPYTIQYKHVELYLNDEYQGVYLLTDQVERADGRVNISDDGYLFERDGYWFEEPLFFKSKLDGFYYTFKYPKPEKDEIKEGDERYVYIKQKIDTLEYYLKNNQSVDQLIDYDSFAKWFICNEILCNMDTNVYYVLPSKNEKLFMYPIWDAEWSLGSAALSNDEKVWMDISYEELYAMKVWENRLYFPYLLKDRLFRNNLKNNWKKYKGSLIKVNSIIDTIAKELYLAQKANFDRWPVMGKRIIIELFVANSYDEELKYIQDFYDKRYAWIDSYISSL